MSIVLTNEEAGFSEEQIAKIKTASDYKDKGDAAFKAGEAKAALQQYHFAIMYCKGIDKSPDATNRAMAGSNDSEKNKPMTEVDVMLEKLYGNQSAAHLKLGNWQRAVETADLCLKKNENNYKAMFRKGKALGEQGFWERAEPILKDLLKKNPAEAPSINAEMARLLEIDKQKRKEANQKLKGWMKRDKDVFGGSDKDKDKDKDKSEKKDEDEGLTPAGPPAVSSATIEEIP